MHFHFSVYSSILLIFVSQGLVFAGLLWQKVSVTAKSYFGWLSLFIGLCCLYIFPFMMGFAGWYGFQPYRDILFYIPFQQTLLMGPVIYFYTQTLLNPQFQFKKTHLWHFLPAAIYAVYSLAIFIMDKVVLDRVYFYSDGRDKDFALWYQLLGLASMVFYAILSLRYYGMYRKFIYHYLSYASQIQVKWLRNSLCIFTVMLFVQSIFLLLFPNWGSFTQKWWYYLIFAFLQYYLALSGFLHQRQTEVPFFAYALPNQSLLSLPYVSPLLLPPNAVVELALADTEKLEPQEQQPEIASWVTTLHDLMVAQQLFKNPTLTLLDVSTLLQTNPTQISRMVNKGFQKNFNDWVNEYRVHAVVQMLHQGEHHKQTLLGISIDCGFNSKTTFNRCFKKIMGVSPKTFLEKLVPNHDMGR